MKFQAASFKEFLSFYNQHNQANSTRVPRDTLNFIPNGILIRKYGILPIVNSPQKLGEINKKEHIDAIVKFVIVKVNCLRNDNETKWLMTWVYRNIWVVDVVNTSNHITGEVTVTVLNINRRVAIPNGVKDNIAIG